MKFRNFQEAPPVQMQLAPMIDIVFLLLIFFLVTWNYSRENELKISVPTADQSKDPRRRFGEQLINVTKDGGVVVNGKQMDDERLYQSLKQVADLRPDQSVILRGDSSVAYEHIVRVLNVCYRAKIFNVAFAAKLPDQP